ncbi:MAG: hypothetical protein HWE24_20625 [Oceanospirillaceae bacterium]|nr:hypothetical protein [Oceanospirillaceae bacterium]
MKLIKTINRENEIVNFYNQPINGGESIIMGGRQYWMVRINKDFSNSEINRRKEVRGNYNVSIKCCKNCNSTMSVKNNFYTSTYSKDGYQSICKHCAKKQNKEYYNEMKLVA